MYILLSFIKYRIVFTGFAICFWSSVIDDLQFPDIFPFNNHVLLPSYYKKKYENKCQSVLSSERATIMQTEVPREKVKGY